MKKYIYFILALVGLNSCNSTKKTTDIIVENIDSLTKPNDDFFQFANGGWIKKNPIPASESAWGIAYLIRDELNEKIISINDESVKNIGSDNTSFLIGNFFKTAMDSTKLNKDNIAPVKSDIEKINSITNTTDLMNLIADFKNHGIGNLLFSNYVGQDDKNSSKMAFFVRQGGLGLPNREYYFNTDENTLKVQNAYKVLASDLLKLIGQNENDAKVNTEKVYQIEKFLAFRSRPMEALNDPYANYNKMNIVGIQNLCSKIEWKSFLEKIEISSLDSVIVGQPEFFTNLNSALTMFSIDEWKNYLKVHYMHSVGNYLDDNTFNLLFKYNQSLSGAKTPKPRIKRVLDVEENLIGELIGQIYVKKYFNENAKKRYSDMVENVREAYADRIKKLDWMTDTTKKKALEKLSKISKKVGYPDQWKDFSSMKLGTSSYLDNIKEANYWWHKFEISKLNKPVDRNEWSMNPQTYNAYYNPSNNEIVLPAGIFMIPGMKDEDVDDAVAYGYAGASTIGHEITHGFDDQGRQYDAQGNLSNWWTPVDEKAFKSKAQFIIDQFSAMVPIYDIHINGEATQGENIADLGGMIIGLDAFKKTKTYKENKSLNGYTPMQRFFLGWALGWLYNTREEQLANRVRTDVHAPAKERVNGPVVNVDEFYTAFNIKKGDKMYVVPEKRVRIW